MIEFFRTTVGKWVARFIVVLLVVAFAFFGTGQFTGLSGSSAVRTVGDEEITISAFQRAFQRRILELRRRPGLSNLNAEQAREFGVHLTVLTELTGEAALVDEAKRIGVEASDAEVIRALVREFPNGSGGVNTTVYEQFLRSERYRAAEFEAFVRDLLTASILRDTARGGGKLGRHAVELVWKRQAQKRDISFITLVETEADAPEAPSDAALKEHYEQNKAEFTRPEYRVVDFLWMKPEDRADPATVSEEAAKARYEERAARYTTAERRNLSVLTFETEEAAKAAAERLRAAEPLQRASVFSEIAKENGVDAEKAGLGFLAKTDLSLFGADVADAVFAGAIDAAPNSVVGPVKALAGWSVYRIAGVAPGTTKSFEEVRDDIKKEIALETARRGMADLQIAIEDQRAGGATLKEIGEDAKGFYKRLVVDRNGLDPEGAPVAGLPDRSRALQLIFPNDAEEETKIVGLERNFVRRSDGGFYTLVVTEIQPEALRPFDEAKEAVAASWRKAQVQAAMAGRAQEAMKRVEAGESFEAVAKALGLEVSSAKGLTRSNRAVAGAPSSVVDALFEVSAEAGATADGALDAAASRDVGEEKPLERRVVARLDAVSDPASEASAAEIARVEAQFDASVSNDLQLALTGALLAARDVATDEAAVRAALGVGATHGGGAR